MLCDAPWPARLQQWSMVDLQLPSLKNVLKKKNMDSVWLCGEVI
jgi:hypothetical protein